MTKTTKKVSSFEIPIGKLKAILRGGTFHRVQVLVDPESSYIEHCGLSYKVTQQKDASGRVICLWAR